MIQRIYFKNVLDSLTRNPAVVLLGPRQIGKTTLAQQIKKEYGADSIYLDLESNRDLRKLNDAETFLSQHQNKLVIIDEAQTMPEIFKTLRPLIDKDRRAGRFLLLGSASPFLIRGVSEYLAGRIEYIELSGFNVIETPKIKVNELWLRGGFPPSLLAETILNSFKWRSSFIKSYIQTELSLLYQVNFSSPMIKNFWQMLAHHNGGIWNASTFANSLGVTAPTVRNYLDYMNGAFLIRKLQPWFVNSEKRLVKSPKIYFRDTGLLHALLNIDEMDELYGHPGAGNSWETFVVEQIASLIDDRLTMYYYRTHHGAEADLVLVQGIKPIAAIEIKLSGSPTITKGFHESIRTLKTKRNFVITPNSDTYKAEDNILVCSLTAFINDHLNGLNEK